jgi:ABC-type multidrug transport system fused ATPase/permease subunit
VNDLLAFETHVIDKVDGVVMPKAGDFDFAIETFAYPDGNAMSLKDIHIHLPKGKMLGLVGKTGSGKSTLLRLLMREFDEYTGSITYGTKSIKEFPMDDYLPMIANVPQDHFLFSMSVRNNIAFAQVDAPMEEVENAAKIASIHEDILGFKDGYDTMVGERGVSLSGGQKQRLSIARALMVDSELLILDDALSAVDAKTEEAILTNLKEGNKQTTIITAHRLSSVMHADEIIVMDEGKIVERGTHEQLLEEDKWYAQMWQLQQIEGEDVEYGRN